MAACEAEPDKYEVAGGKPPLKYVRVPDPAAADSLLTGAYMETTICLVGENLRSVYELYFNDQKDVYKRQTINPADIVSMEILKDASATAMYGAQGSNGVVLSLIHILIILEVCIHGIPVTMQQSVYDALAGGGLSNYWMFGRDNRDASY